MSFKITDPDAFESAGDAALAHGSFALYRIGTHIRAYASTDEHLMQNAPFENTLDASGLPVDHLWVDAPESYTVVFRRSDGVEVSRGPLVDSLGALSPLERLNEQVSQIEG